MARKPSSSAAAKRVPATAGFVSEFDRRINWIIIAVLFVVPFLFYGKYLFNGRMLFGTDLLGAGSFALRYYMKQYVAQHGWIAYWLPGLLCGQPTGAAFYADLFYPTLFARMLLPVDVVWTWTFILHVFAAGLGTYLFLRELKVTQIAAGLGGLGYMLAGSLLTLTYAGHDGRLIGSALLPFAPLFLHRGIARRRFVWFLLMGLVLALQLLSGHIQKVYYTGLMLTAYFIFELIRTIRHAPPGTHRTRLGFQLAAFFLIGAGFSVALSAIQYLPIYGNMPYASRGGERGYEFATSWSMPIAESFDLLTPKFSGGLEAYWGKNPFKLHSEYLGILPLLFAFIAVFRRWRDRLVRFFTFSFAGALLMAWGGNTPFYYVPYYLLPGISKFRGPAMIFFIAAFSLVMLAGLGVDYLLREHKTDESRKATRTIFAAGGVVVLLAIVFAVFKEPMMQLLRSATTPTPQKLEALNANYPNLQSGLLFAAFVAAIGAVLAWALVTRRVRPVLVAGGIGLVMLLDIGFSLNLWNEAKGYIRGAPRPAAYYAPDEVTAFLKADTGLYRVLPLNYERSDDGILLIHGIHSTGGQIPNPLQSYQDFIGAGQSVMFAAGNLMNPAVMNVANVKYVITYALPDDVSQYDERSRQTIAQLKAYFSQPQFELAMRGQRYAIYRNRSVLPRAFIASSFEVMKDKDQLLDRLMSPGFDPTRTALLYADPQFTPTAESLAGSVTVTSYDANRVTLKVTASAACLVVLSENFQPDYRVAVDGKPASVLRAYHTLRAVTVPAGEHELVFTYQSNYYRVGTWLTLASIVFLCGTLGFSALRQRRRGQAGGTTA
jgi:hypothetical protein